MSISNDLRQAVLQAAIQGKLTKQLPEDGNAKDLLEQIKAEKEKLIKEGKLKKEKPLPEITKDEKPFDIPENWEWVRLGEIVRVLGDGIHGTPVFDELGEYYFVNGNNLVKGKIVIKDNTKRVSIREYEKYRKHLDKNTILLSINGTIGNFAFYDGEPIILGKSACYFSVLGNVEKEYICNLINTKWFSDYAVKEATQTTIKNVSLKAMRMLPLPLPSLAEQKRIVAKVEELMAKIDDLEKTEKELDALKKAFPTDMKASLLQEAMQGKLTEQLPEDGNAKDLLEQIKAEKAKLIKGGKLKKEKPLPEITEDEKPFGIPDNWEWVRLGELIRISSGDGLVRNNMSVDGEYPVYGGNGVTGYHNRYNIDECMLVIGRVGFYCGSTHITEEKAWVTDNAFITYFDKARIDINWLKHLVDVLDLRKRSSSTAQPVVSGKTIYPIAIPFPPLAEQKRIVEKLDKLLPLCDGLK